MIASYVTWVSFSWFHEARACTYSTARETSRSYRILTCWLSEYASWLTENAWLSIRWAEYSALWLATWLPENSRTRWVGITKLELLSSWWWSLRETLWLLLSLREGQRLLLRGRSEAQSWIRILLTTLWESCNLLLLTKGCSKFLLDHFLFCNSIHINCTKNLLLFLRSL